MNQCRSKPFPSAGPSWGRGTREEERGWSGQENGTFRGGRKQNGLGRRTPHQTGPVQPIEALVALGGVEEEEGEGDEELQQRRGHVGGDGGREADEDDEGQRLQDQVCGLARQATQAWPGLVSSF